MHWVAPFYTTHIYVFVNVVTFDIHVDLTFKMMGRKCEKYVTVRENVRNLIDKKEAPISHNGLFKL